MGFSSYETQSPGPTVSTCIHTFQSATSHPQQADWCSVFAKQTPRNPGEESENITLPSYLHIQSGNKQLHLLPQATACSVLINLPFIEFPYLSPNTTAPLHACVKAALSAPGALGHQISDQGEKRFGSHREVNSWFDPITARWGGGLRRRLGEERGAVGKQGLQESALQRVMRMFVSWLCCLKDETKAIEAAGGGCTERALFFCL